MLQVAILGAGQGGSSLLRALVGMGSRIRVVGIADKNPAAPGLNLAKSLGLPTWTDFRLLVSRPDLDVIVQATGDPAVDEACRDLKRPEAVMIEGLAMNLMRNGYLTLMARHLMA